MGLADILKKIDDCFGKLYSATKQFNQLEKGISSYIANNDLRNFLGYKEDIQLIDGKAIKENAIYKGVIAQFLVRYAMAVDTVSQTNGAIIRELDVKECFIIKQIVRLYQTGRVEQIFSGLKSGSAYLVDSHEISEIIDGLGRRYGSSRLSTLKEDMNDNKINSLDVLSCMLVHLKYNKGFNIIIDDEIVKQDEDLFQKKIVAPSQIAEEVITPDLVKRLAMTFINNSKSAQQNLKMLLIQSINLITDDEIATTRIYKGGPKNNSVFSNEEIILIINEAIIRSKEISNFSSRSQSNLSPIQYKNALCSFLNQIGSEEMSSGAKGNNL